MNVEFCFTKKLILRPLCSGSHDSRFSCQCTGYETWLHSEEVIVNISVIHRPLFEPSVLNGSISVCERKEVGKVVS